MSCFRALLTSAPRSTASVELSDDSQLATAGVLVSVAWSAISHLDALAITGQIALPCGSRLGLDLAGYVLSSDHPRWSEGDAIIATGSRELGCFIGGLAERARVPASMLLPLPEGLSLRSAMTLGTPGLAAALAVEHLEAQAVTPERGPVFVTGATGGLGSVAVALLAALGYEVIAYTRRPALRSYLVSLGSSEVREHQGALLDGTGPRWSGGIDTVGGAGLMQLLAGARPTGAIVACGSLAGAVPQLQLDPFITQGVCLLGCDALGLERAARADLWDRLARDFDLASGDLITTVIPLDGAAHAAAEILTGNRRGRTVVEVDRPCF